ncbi:MAG: hypothetical protein RLZZ385_687 [Pseudomonadota bacterium]|jgi:threonine dehydratase
MTLTIEAIRAAAARLQGQAVRTPLLNNAQLDLRTGARVFVKAENLQHIGAFKFRGAFNRLCQLDGEQRRRGVVAFSSGNHAQGVAYAARLLGMPATIVMPSDAPQVKIDGTRLYGAEIRLYDRHKESREAIAAEISERTGQVIVPAFEDPHIMAGQGTCGLEIAEQLQELGLTPDLVLVPCGGGGLLAGVSTALLDSFPRTRMIGVEPEGFDDHRQSRISGKRVGVSTDNATLCDSLMAPMPGELTWAVNSQSVSDFITVNDEQVKAAVSFAFRFLKLVIEPGGVVGLAALLHGVLPVRDLTVVVVVSGGNIDGPLFCDCLRSYPSP